MAGTCEAKGKGWACERDQVSNGYCNGHNMQRHRGTKLRPLRIRRDEPSVSLTVWIPAAIKSRLGERPSARATEILEAALRKTGTGSKR